MVDTPHKSHVFSGVLVRLPYSLIWDVVDGGDPSSGGVFWLSAHLYPRLWCKDGVVMRAMPGSPSLVLLVPLLCV